MTFSPFLIRRRWLFAAVALVPIIAFGWLNGEPTSAYETVVVGRGDVEATVVAIGTLQPRYSVDVGAQVSGQIMRLHVEPGDQVEKGQLLAEIDASLHEATVEADRAALLGLRAQLEEQQAQLLLARQQHERQIHLARLDATREEDVQTAAAGYKSARARLDNLRAQIAESQALLKRNEAQLSYTRIYAPIAGSVLGVDVKEGQTLNATYQTPTVMRIADLRSMTGWTRVSEADIRRVKAGLPLYFTTLGGDERRWHSTVRQVLPAPPVTPTGQGEASSGAAEPEKVVQYTVLFEVDNSDGELMPQMTAQVVFVTASAKDVLTAPLDALQGKPGNYQVRILAKGEQPETRAVKVGARDRQVAEILDGLQEGERLVTGEAQAESGMSRFQW
ncbi:efflux RND transporter periplasmic adaptor subunit [Pseudomonas daroniae]|uniref:Efflux RND transporter periplasmic adaptor subunit n=1 Tax=Phytopseudomonas daroniae TaxID=2487519 RepID=A0A4Q9QJV6_9GAMM|nr:MULTISPECIES: efflux RND transporter periplasmic adaptor subunit [Pseudomonas]TBU74367.1 efflux RND transporter periplasmic adaptor subunit [Pseudomonas daroniae]TBU85449.1 efflux RND transporter periplasmic adaptor subunit [Pseudomonas sp. FRB 228]TBU94297.1 efflux RND transporter periplasmic adaptor subunit [Pseudomonas daroniae]